MNFIIILVVVILYAALCATTYTNMKMFNNKTKIIYIITGTIINLIITYIVVSINKINIADVNVYKYIKRIDILIFTSVNGLVSMPTFAKYMNNYKMELIDKNNLNKKTICLLICFVIILILEGSYLKGLNV